MQYPIIDNLIYAYQQNGWTGLEVIEGKNLVDSSRSNSGLLSVSSGSSINDVIPSTRYSYSDPVNSIDGVAISVKSNNISTFVQVYINRYNNDIMVATTSHLFTDTTEIFSVIIQPNTYEKVCLVYGAPQNQIVGTDIDGDIQIESGTIVTPYEPYHATTDIKNRLKLPLIRYFPHPVIDAIISAADGQHTEEEKEILRHYLTPLGIGGI